MSNYRPISLISVLSKPLEKLIYKRLVNYITEKNIVYCIQFGLAPIINRACNPVSYWYHSKVYRSTKLLMWNFSWFSKAFDTIDHDILIRKLEIYGIRGSLLRVTCLYYTKQFVSIQDNNFEYANIPWGAPQGTLLVLFFFSNTVMTLTIVLKF